MQGIMKNPNPYKQSPTSTSYLIMDLQQLLIGNSWQVPYMSIPLLHSLSTYNVPVRLTGMSYSRTSCSA